jgi:hypothetical protein
MRSDLADRTSKPYGKALPERVLIRYGSLVTEPVPRGHSTIETIAAGTPTARRVALRSSGR